MKKIHTKVKRSKGLSSHVNQYNFFHPTGKKKRPKTFASEEKAHAWAEKSGLKKEDYAIKKAKKNKKFQIVSLKNK